MNSQFNTPVLFLVFNRPEKTKMVFEQIRLLQPKFLYVAADGAREHIADERQKCNEVREIIRTIDWDCEVKYLLRDINLGCSNAVVSAIDWFFSREECGIILEDDCFPDLSFFPFCDELLEKYKDDPKVMMISGSNLGTQSGDASYFFSKYGQIWGWATWRRAWEKFERTIKVNDPAIVFASKKEKRFWERNFAGIIWDVQWAVYSVWKNKGVAIIPNNNLISNIGFGMDATNYTDETSSNANIGLSPVSFPLVHPSHNEAFAEIDRDIFDRFYYTAPTKKIVRKIKRSILKMKKVVFNKISFNL